MCRKSHPNSFRTSMQPLLVFAQICGLLPVKGIFGATVKFSWINPFHLYGLVIFGVTLFFDILYTIDNFKTGLGIDVFASTVFYTTCLLTMVFFLGIAKRFHIILATFLEIENLMTDYGYPKYLGLKIKSFFYGFITLAIIEHGTMAVVHMNWAWSVSKRDHREFLYNFYTVYFPSISVRVPYSAVGTIVLFWVNVTCTLNWNYLDFFLIVMSMEISSRFRLITLKLKNSNLLTENKTFWRKVSSDYNSLSLLTKKMDKLLSKIILMSFFSNMYHISLQLVRSLKIGNGTLFQRTYFYFSMSYLIVRMLLVLFSAAKIKEESGKPAEHLFAVRYPCTEFIRFLHQILTDDVALTGSKFFVITRKFAASVIGTIVTYQVFLLQFNSLKLDN